LKQAELLEQKRASLRCRAELLDHGARRQGKLEHQRADLVGEAVLGLGLEVFDAVVGRAALGLTDAPLFPFGVDGFFDLSVFGFRLGAQLPRPAGDDGVELIFVFARKKRDRRAGEARFRTLL
jgi:hypothetical protein